MAGPSQLVVTQPPFPYTQAEYETVPCNLCGSRETELIANRDRNGLPVRSNICTTCGLIYLSPRMTPRWYARYYAVEYRRQMAAFKGQPVTAVAGLDKIFQTQLRRGAWLIEYLKRHDIPPPRSVLDIGSSTGGLLRALADVYGAQVLGVEPSPEEGAYAAAHGVPTHVGLFEQFQPPADGQFDLVLCTQSFNHLLDPRQVAAHVRRCLTPQGVFFLECQDFFHVCQTRRALYEAVQIDHVYMFVPATLQAMLEVAGLTVIPGSQLCDRYQTAADLRTQRGASVPSLHVRMLARPGEPAIQPSNSYAEVRAELATMPNAPFRATLHRGWQQVRRRLRAYTKNYWPRKRQAGEATTRESAAPT